MTSITLFSLHCSTLLKAIVYHPVHLPSSLLPVFLSLSLLVVFSLTSSSFSLSVFIMSFYLPVCIQLSHQWCFFYGFLYSWKQSKAKLSISTSICVSVPLWSFCVVSSYTKNTVLCKIKSIPLKVEE